MIRYGESIRFASHELEEFREIGINLNDVKDQRELEQELGRWAELVARERPHLLEKIARAMVEAKGIDAANTGLRVVARDDG